MDSVEQEFGNGTGSDDNPFAGVFDNGETPPPK
jgi:hypothetical protein